MKPHLISKELLGRQVYRYHPAYRVAAFLLCCFLLLQLPMVAWIIYERDLTQQRQARAAELAGDAAKLALERKGLADTEKKLKPPRSSADSPRASAGKRASRQTGTARSGQSDGFQHRH
jgi:hypothetical protein